MERVEPPGEASGTSGAVDQTDVLRRVSQRVSESLAVSMEDIKMESRLMEDLRADSLDFLDMIFAFEDEFGVPLHEKTVDKLLRTDFEDGSLTEEGFLPREDVDKLAQWLPALEAAECKYEIPPQKVFNYVTIEALVLLIGRELELAG